VLGGIAAPSPVKGARPSVFGPCLLWPNGWMDEDATWYESRPGPRLLCVRRDPAPPPRERGTAAPSFRLMSIVATAADVSYCLALVLFSLVINDRSQGNVATYFRCVGTFGHYFVTNLLLCLL